MKWFEAIDEYLTPSELFVILQDNNVRIYSAKRTDDKWLVCVSDTTEKYEGGPTQTGEGRTVTDAIYVACSKIHYMGKF